MVRVFLYPGRYYKLTIVDNQREPIRFENGFYLSKMYLSLARDVLTAWYKREAFEKLTQRVELYAKNMGFKYNKVNIINAQKRWDSCSGSNLNFSWRLIMAPLSVIDYKVRILMPAYEKHHQWLKENSYLLIW
jgi:predicted metal-dependent hydrolase